MFHKHRWVDLLIAFSWIFLGCVVLKIIAGLL